ncbi:MAG: hypothetical protein V4449_01385 [Patescibacteria group bacterium]
MSGERKVLLGSLDSATLAERRREKRTLEAQLQKPGLNNAERAMIRATLAMLELVIEDEGSSTVQ